MLFVFVIFIYAQASDFVLSIDSIQPGIGATWSFPIFVDEQWYLASGQGGDLTIAPMDDSGWVNMEEVRTITDEGIIKDHALRMCPSGHFLYAASTGVENDVLVYVLDDTFQILSEDILPQSEPLHAGNDMAAICSPLFQGVGVAELQGLRDYFYPIDEDGFLAAPVELYNAPRMTGAGLWEYDGMMYAIGRDARPELSVAIYDSALDLQGQLLIPPISEEIVNYWSSSVLSVDDYFLLLSMGRNPDDDWPLDTGNVYLAILTKDMELLEWLQLTDFEPSSGGGMRPWMHRHQDQLWVSYDRNNTIELLSIQIFEDAFVVEVDEPSQEPNQDSNVDSETDTGPKEGGCAGLLFLPLLLSVRRIVFFTNRSIFDPVERT